MSLFLDIQGDPLVSLTGPQVLIKEYLPSVKVLAETEVNAYERLLADDRPILMWMNTVEERADASERCYLI